MPKGRMHHFAELACANCSAPFATDIPGQKYCGADCGKAARKARRPRRAAITCKRCGNQFVKSGPGFHGYCAECNQCGVEGCYRPRDHGNWCDMHSMRVIRHGAAGPAHKLPSNPKAGQGGFDAQGYHVLTVSGRKKKAHRLAMEKLLGRELLPGETVHHLNTIKSDNRTDGPLDAEFKSGNLQLWRTSQPTGGRVSDHVAYAIELLDLYAPDLLAAKPVQLRLVV